MSGIRDVISVGAYQAGQWKSASDGGRVAREMHGAGATPLTHSACAAPRRVKAAQATPRFHWDTEVQYRHLNMSFTYILNGTVTILYYNLISLMAIYVTLLLKSYCTWWIENCNSKWPISKRFSSSAISELFLTVNKQSVSNWTHFLRSSLINTEFQ